MKYSEKIYENIPTQLIVFKPETTKLVFTGNTYLRKHTGTRYGLKVIHPRFYSKFTLKSTVLHNTYTNFPSY